MTAHHEAVRPWLAQACCMPDKPVLIPVARAEYTITTHITTEPARTH